MRPKLAFLYLVLGVVSFQLWKLTGDLWWTLGACGFALSSIGETLLFLKETKRQ
jgi:hypothetical protein